MTSDLIVKLAEIAGAVVLLAICLQAFFRPRYMISVQKTTNAASQPEIVSIQANLPWWSSADTIWRQCEKMASVAVSRMTTCNEMILDVTRAFHERVAVQRPPMKSKFLRKQEKRRREHVARQLGIPIDQVTDEQVQQVVSQAQNGTIEAKAE